MTWTSRTLTSNVSNLPHALTPGGKAAPVLSGRPAVFLDYDGVLTPIVDRPQDAVMSDEMRDTVRSLATRCTVCVITGRDREVAQHLMGMDDLAVAGSHGFDIWIPGRGSVFNERLDQFTELIESVTEVLGAELASIPGALVEPKRASVAVHDRLVGPQDRARVEAVVSSVLAAHPEELTVIPGKRVHELKPNVDWDKGRALLYLLEVLELDSEGVTPVYLGDDVTDEDAFTALQGGGLGVLVADPGEPDSANRQTAATCYLRSVDEVRQFLSGMAT